jgi:hypothetical protein
MWFLLLQSENSIDVTAVFAHIVVAVFLKMMPRLNISFPIAKAVITPG